MNKLLKTKGVGYMSNYFTFNAAEKKYLEAINSANDEKLSQYASKNSDAVRLKTPRYDIIRPQYSYDIDCIIHSPLYNRYSDKTQVFSFYKNDDITRRALHVQFVSKIANELGIVCNVVSVDVKKYKSDLYWIYL